MDRPIDVEPTTLEVGGERSWTAQVHLCRQSWYSLEPTADARVRRCEECHRTVMLVVDLDGYRRAAVDYQCVAFDATKPGPIPEKRLFLGGPATGYPKTGSGGLTWD